MSKSKKQRKNILLSGGFDPLHPGHIAMIEQASEYGEVHIALNSDDWLVKKKGFYFQPWEDRKKMLEAYTPHIHEVDDTDGTVCAAIETVMPDYFGNGGDRTKTNTPELELCEKVGVEPVFGMGGNKYSSSSAVNAKGRVDTRWGWYHVLIDMPKLKVKILEVKKGKSLSLQRHTKRSEFFFMPNGEVRVNLPGVWHKLTAPEDRNLTVLEVQLGVSEESDEERILETDTAFEKWCQEKIELNN